MDIQTAVDEAIKMTTDMFWQPLPCDEKKLRKWFEDLFADFEESVTEKVKGTVGEWLDRTTLVSGI